jgi:hypothetical protein
MSKVTGSKRGKSNSTLSGFLNSSFTRTSQNLDSWVSLRSLKNASFAFAMLNCVMVNVVEAQTWNPTSGPPYLWSNAANWSGGVPVATSNVTISNPTTCTLDVNATIARITFSGNLNLNGRSLTINGNGVTNTFTNGTITNSGAAKTLSIANATSEGTTISGTTFGAGVDFSVNNSGTAYIVLSGGATFNDDVNVVSPDIYWNGATFNAISTFHKTGTAGNVSSGGNIFNAAATIIYDGPISILGTSTYNSDLTIDRRNSGILQQSFKLKGNLIVSDISSSPSIGIIEFIGNAAQTISRGSGGFTALSSGNIFLNKTGTSTVTLLAPLQYLTIYGTATFTNGVFVGNVGLNGSVTGGNNLSYVSGSVTRGSVNGAFTFPIGDAGCYRPITLSPDARDFSCTYYKSTPANTNSVNGLTNVSLCEYWFVRANDPPNVSITLSWVSAECYNPASGYVNDLANLRVASWENQWRDRGNTGTTGTVAAGTITSTSINTNTSPWNGTFTLGSDDQPGNQLLPIELSEFYAKLTAEHQVNLEWLTATELNNHYFEIQRSKDGLSFATIGEVEGHGTSREPNSYSWLDQQPFSGWSYYRLKQVDFDGKFTHSDPISIHNVNETKFSVYPVPTRGKTLFLSVKDDVKVFNLMGDLVFSDSDVSEISLEGFEPGIYLIRIPSGDQCRFVVN